jgi:hypothetical protein
MDVVNSQIGRLVAFVLTPILLPIGTAVAAWLQNAVGIDLHGDQLTGYVVAVAAGLAIVFATWLRNRGQWEIAQAQVQQLHGIGQPPPLEGLPPVE